jgi:hypothetical protein
MQELTDLYRSIIRHFPSCHGDLNEQFAQNPVVTNLLQIGTIQIIGTIMPRGG